MIKRFDVDVSNINIEEVNNKDFMKLKIYAISDQVNRNSSEFLRDSFEKSIPTMYNKPILAYYNSDLDDTEQHNGKLNIDDDGIYTDYQYPEGERAVGVIPESASIYVENIEGKNWVVIDGCIIWTEYNRQLYKLIKKQLKKKVSVEVELLDYEDVGDVTRINQWKFLGVTVLGKNPEDGSDVEEGIEGAHLQTIDYTNSLKFSRYLNKLSFALKDKSSVLSKYGIKESVISNMALTVRELENKLWSDLRAYECEDGECECYYRYYIEDIILEDKVVIVKDNEDGDIYAINYETDSDDVYLNMSTKRKAENIYVYKKKKEETKVAVMVSQEEYGSGSAITIDKSKESVSDTSWGSVNKMSLRNKVLKASNYKTLVKSVYLKVEDGWEDSPSEHLKYPVMQIIGDKAVYNAGGLLSAQQYGESNDESVANKAESIRKKLGLTESKKEENMKKFIEAAKESGLICLGLQEGKLLFAKEVNFEDEEKELESVSIYEIEKEACGDTVEFESDKLEKCKAFEEDEEDDDDKDGEDKKKLEEAKEEAEMKCAKAEEEKENMAKELEAVKKELEAKKDEEFAKETDAIMAKDEELDDDSKKELAKMREEKKFASIEDFVKELSYMQYIKKEKKDTSAKLDFSINAKSGKPEETKPNSLDERLKKI